MVLGTFCVAGCREPGNLKPISNSTHSSMFRDTGIQKEMTCKLTSRALQERKATVMASLKKKIAERKELPNGYSYKFDGTDNIIDEITTFIKTERLCCDFFDFAITVKGDGSAAWLTITGQEGVKEFIVSELAL